MNILNEMLIPFEGLGKIKLLSSLAEIKSILKENKITYVQKNWPNKGCTPEVPWLLICIDKSITLFFAKNKLWKIYCEGNFSGSLPSGVKIGMPMNEALKIDSSLKFNDWNEEFESTQGYWIEDNLDTNKVASIAIFIKECLNENLFYKYEW